MKRINGFLDLDEYFRDKQEEDIKEGNCYFDYWLTIEGNEYYYKYTENPYPELICSEIAKYLGMNAVAYDLAIFKNTKGVISKSYRKENCNYISGVRILNAYLRSRENVDILKEMGLKNKFSFSNVYLPRDINNLETIWQAIEYRYSRLGIECDIEKIMYDIVQLFIFNILTGQDDGLPQNWELEESEHGVSLVPIFDNEYCLSSSNKSKLTTSFNDTGLNNYRILEEFLKMSSQEFINVFIEKFNMLTFDVFLKILKKVETKIGSEIPQNIRIDYMINFKLNLEHISAILEHLKLQYNKRS